MDYHYSKLISQNTAGSRALENCTASMLNIENNAQREISSITHMTLTTQNNVALLLKWGKALFIYLFNSCATYTRCDKKEMRLWQPRP